MKKIIIVGHPSSEYQDVETLLIDCGMRSAKPSRNEGILPVEIGAILCKAHSAKQLNEMGPTDEIHQIDVSSVWNGMALDILWGNLDQKLWGWSDPQAVYLLDYWKNLDPKITFILVYNHPRSLLTLESNNTEILTSQVKEQLIRHWSVYNAALLHFFYRNPERCLLVHSQQVRQSSNSYLQQVYTHIDAPLTTNAAGVVFEDFPTCCNSGTDEDCSDLPEKDGVKHNQTVVKGESLLSLQVSSGEIPLNRYLADAVMTLHPADLQLYEELQAAATLPYVDSATDIPSVFDAWQSMANHQQHIMQLQLESQFLKTMQNEKQQESDLLLFQLHQLQEEHEKRSKEYIVQLEELRQKEKDFENNELQKESENELLLLQLHRVQESLEQYCLENQKLRSDQSPAPYGAAERIKSQLSYQLGATMLKGCRSFFGLLLMPFSLLRVIRQFHQEEKQRKEEVLLPIHEYRDASEAERVKQHLSYRLGMAWLDNIRSPIGWIKMPWALSNAVKEFRLDRIKDTV